MGLPSFRPDVSSVRGCFRWTRTSLTTVRGESRVLTKDPYDSDVGVFNLSRVGLESTPLPRREVRTLKYFDPDLGSRGRRFMMLGGRGTFPPVSR